MSFAIKRIFAGGVDWLRRIKVGPLRDRLLRTGLLAISLKVSGLVLATLLSVIIARQFGIEAIGVIILGVSLGSLAGEIANSGMSESLTKWVAENISLHEEARAVAAVSSAARYSFFVVFCLSLLMLWGASQIVIAEEDLPLFAASLFGNAYLRASGIYLAALRGLRRSWQSLLLEVLPVPVLSLVLLSAAYIAVSNIHVDQYIAIWLLAAFVSIALRITYWYSSAPRRAPKLRVPVVVLLLYSRPFFLGNLVFFAIAHIDKLMLGWLGSPGAVGGYAIALRIASLIAMFQSVSDSFVAPRLAHHSARDDLEKLMEVASKSVTYLLGLATPVALGFLVLGGTLLSIWGDEFVGFTNVLVVLTIGQFASVISGPCGRLLLYRNFGSLRNAIVVGALAIDLVVCVALIPAWGAAGAAVATASSMITLSVLSWLAVGIKLGRFVIPRWKYLRVFEL